MTSPADLPQDPPRFRIVGSTIPQTDPYVPSMSFVSYDVGWGPKDAEEALQAMKENMPPGTRLELQSTQDRWEPVKTEFVVVPRPIKDSPQA